jgi:ABC-2 type transport system permease protein
MSILAGMAVGGIAMTSVRSVFAIAIGFGIFGVRLQSFAILPLLGVFLVTMIALYSLGMLLSSAFLLYGREAWHLCNALTEPVYFVSGMYFPLRTLGALGSFAAGLVPLALGIDAMRQLLIGADSRGLLPVRLEFAILIVLGVVLFLIARFALRYIENLSKREGRLTQRWQ